MNRDFFPRIKLFSLITALSLSAGCGYWENFTTYFNLYYNTSTLFEEAENDILSQKRDLFSIEPLVIPGNANTNLVKVIEKSSKILQFHSSSAYVEDALMMLGKSFFYQKNYQKAKRKFEELIGTEPDDDVLLESEFWIAKCNMTLRDYANGLVQLEDVRIRAIENDETEIIVNSFIEEIIYRLTVNSHDLAIELSNELLAYSDSEMKSKVYYELGKLYTDIGDLDKAITAYSNVFEHSPDFDLEVEANVKYAATLREAGRDEEALNEFRSMRGKDKFIDKFNMIDLETGITLEKMGRNDEALDQFNMVDTTYRNSPVSSAANYFKGRIYEYALGEYDSAGVYYQKALTSNPPVEYTQIIRDKNQLFNRYITLRKQINNYDRQLFYFNNPEVFIEDSINYVQDSLQILSDYLEQKELFDIWSNVFKPDSAAIKDSLLALDSLRIQDSLHVRDSLITLMNIGVFADTNEVNLAIIDYYRAQDSLHVRDSLMQLVDVGVILDTNEVNRLVTEYFKAKDEGILNLKGDEKDPGFPQTIAGVNLDTIQFKRNPPRKPSIPVDSVKYIISKTQLELGNLFLTEMDVPDSAYTLYNDNIQRFPQSEFYPNTLYALGSYYLTLDDKGKADSLFQYIYDNYKSESIVNAAADKLSLPLIDLEYDAAKDLYKQAESDMIAGNYDSALKEFLSIHRLYPESPISPKALYAGGWILEKDLKLPDSAAVVYDSLVALYAGSVYSREVAKKLGGYKQEKLRLQKELEEADRLAQLENGKDSVDKISGVQNEFIDDTTDYISEAFETDLEELQKNEQERIKESQLKPDIIKPETESGKRKLEALWNPRKPG
ncbi:MAG: tetratricopeptide repeat protein [Ignavibacteriaceae bacterium]